MTGVFKAGKFEKEIFLQFLPNEVYLYDINMKLIGIVSYERLSKKTDLMKAQSEEFLNAPFNHRP